MTHVATIKALTGEVVIDELQDGVLVITHQFNGWGEYTPSTIVQVAVMGFDLVLDEPIPGMDLRSGRTTVAITDALRLGEQEILLDPAEMAKLREALWERIPHFEDQTIPEPKA